MRNTVWTWIGLLALLVGTHTNAIAVTLSAQVLDSYIEVGDTFDVEIWADAEGSGWELSGFGFDVDVDGVVLNYAGYAMGGVFDDVSDSGNALNVSGLFNPANVSSDNLLLATLSFSAVGDGLGWFSLSGIYDAAFYGLFYLDGDLNEQSADINLSRELTVHSANTTPAAVPEPGTLVLVGAGLAALLWRRRKKSEIV